MSEPSSDHFLLYAVLIVIVMGVLDRVEARRHRLAEARRARLSAGEVGVGSSATAGDPGGHVMRRQSGAASELTSTTQEAPSPCGAR